MKLAVISPFLFRFNRGIERFTWNLSSELVTQGVEVDILTIGWPKPIHWGNGQQAMGIKKVPFTRFFQFTFASHFYRSWIKQGSYDCVMLFFAGFGESRAVLNEKETGQQSYCVVLHFPPDLVPHRYQEFIDTRLVAKASQVVAVSEHVAEGARHVFNRQCHVIENGVDLESFMSNRTDRETIREDLDIESETPILITLAALEERKGIQWVIRSIPYLIINFPDIQYWIFGEGAYRKELEAEIMGLGIEKHVRLFGRVDDVVPYLAAADIGCLLSHGESFGISILEYMATKLPVIASQHPPFDKIVQPGWGIRVDETQPKLVAQEISAVLYDQSLRKTLGTNGRNEVVLNYSWSKVADKYRNLLFNGCAI